MPTQEELWGTTPPDIRRWPQAWHEPECYIWLQYWLSLMVLARASWLLIMKIPEDKGRCSKIDWESENIDSL